MLASDHHSGHDRVLCSGSLLLSIEDSTYCFFVGLRVKTAKDDWLECLYARVYMSDGLMQYVCGWFCCRIEVWCFQLWVVWSARTASVLSVSMRVTGVTKEES